MIQVTRKPAALVRNPSLVSSQAPPYSTSSTPCKLQCQQICNLFVFENNDHLFQFYPVFPTCTAVIQTYTMPAERPAKSTSPRKPLRGSRPQNRPRKIPRI